MRPGPKFQVGDRVRISGQDEVRTVMGVRWKNDAPGITGYGQWFYSLSFSGGRDAAGEWEMWVRRA